METVMLTKTKRNRLEALNAILTTSAEGVKKTHIMYRANLSHQQLEKFLEFLTSKGLIMKEGDYYNTTSKGLIFIKEFEKIQSLMVAS
jgi:predicted transcriptional regulator